MRALFVLCGAVPGRVMRSPPKWTTAGKEARGRSLFWEMDTLRFRPKVRVCAVGQLARNRVARKGRQTLVDAITRPREMDEAGHGARTVLSLALCHRLPAKPPHCI